MKNLSRDYIDYRLEEWARWTKQDQQLTKGYPSSSIITLFRTGIVMNDKHHAYVELLQCNEQAEEIEHSLAALERFNQMIADAIKKKYLYREMPMAMKASWLGISEATYRVHLAMAEMWIGGYLWMGWKKKRK